VKELQNLEELRDFWREADPPLEERMAFVRDFWDMTCRPERWTRGANPGDIAQEEQEDFEKRLGKFLKEAPRLLAQEPDYIPVFPTIIGAVEQASAFGCEIVQVGGSDTIWAKPLITSYDPDAILALELPLVGAGLQGKCLNLARQAEEFFRGGIPVRIGDMQGPVDVAGMVWPMEHLFRAMIEHPNVVHHLVGLATELLINFHKAMEAEVTQFTGLHCPGSMWMPPELGTALSEDFAPMLSPAMYAEFSLPYVNRISEACGGVFIHCCGKFDHNYQNFLQIHNLRGVNPAVPPAEWPSFVEAFAEAGTMAAFMGPGATERWADHDVFLEYLQAHTPRSAHLFLI
jgi:hypothetical protein